MIEETQSEIKDYHFTYPKRPVALALFCHALILTVFYILYSNHISDADLGQSFAVTIVSYLFLITLWLWEWPRHLLGRGEEIVLHEDGITIGEHFAEWEEMDRIEHGPLFFWRNSIVRIKLRREKPGLLEIPGLFGSKPHTLTLSGYPFIYRNVIPAIKAVRPDIQVSPIIEKYVTNPQNGGAPRSWLIASLLILNSILLAAVFSPTHQGLFSIIILSAVIGFLCTTFPDFCIPVVRNTRDRLLKTALQCPFIFAFAFRLHIVSTAEHVALETLAVTVITLSAIALIVLVLVKNLSGVMQILIIIALLITPAFYHYYSMKSAWSYTDISHLMPKETWTTIWGRDGTYLSSLSDEGMEHVVHLPTLTKRPVPKYEGRNRVVWLDSRRLIRVVSHDKKKEKLWVHDFIQKRDYRIPTNNKLSVGRFQPVSPDGVHFAWLDCQEGRKRAVLKVWNLTKTQEEHISCSLDPVIAWGYGGVTWVSNTELVFFSRKNTKKSEKSHQLQLLRFNVVDGKRTSIASPHYFRRWYPTPDFRYALATNHGSVTDGPVFLIDFERGISKRLPGKGGFPLVLPSNDSALRVVVQDGNWMLARIDLPTGKQTPLYQVPPEVALSGISLNGLYALLSQKEMLSSNVSFLVDVQSGQQKALYVRGMGSLGVSGQFVAALPGTSPFSPGSSMFLLETVGMGDMGLMLYQIPEGWGEE